MSAVGAGVPGQAEAQAMGLVHGGAALQIPVGVLLQHSVPPLAVAVLQLSLVEHRLTSPSLSSLVQLPLLQVQIALVELPPQDQVSDFKEPSAQHVSFTAR